MSDCQKVKELLPLWVGQDLTDGTASHDVERHLKECSDCDQHRKGLQSSLDVLQVLSSRSFTTERQHESLWPRIADRISVVSRSQQSTGRNNRFSGWIPASVMMVAVATMVTVSLPSIRDELFNAQARTNRDDLFDSSLRMDVKQSIEKPGVRHGDPLGTPVKLELNRKKETKEGK